jgi:hypothetical protein
MIKVNFPRKEGHTEGGYSNGYRFQIDFVKDNDDESLNLLRKFLNDQGFESVSLPPVAERLWWDYFQPDSSGNLGSYVWHPIVITPSRFGNNGLTLFIYDVENPEHKELWILMRKPIH